MGSYGCFALGSLLATAPAWATPCETPSLTGDPELVSQVMKLLVVPMMVESCAALRVRLERRRDAIAVIRLDARNSALEERVVSEPRTAATVIESWTSTELERSLLSMPRAVAPTQPLSVAADPIVEPRVRRVVSPPFVSPSAVVEVLGVMETSFANDGTSWVGGVVGICVRVGRICLATRARFATLVEGEGIWETTNRHGVDAVFGGDIPFDIGRTTIVLGFGVGMGTVRTSVRGEDAMAEGSVTFGIRADTHVAWVVPLGHRVSLDLSATFDMAQVTDVEASTHGPVSNDPTVLGRMGVGIRFGGP